MTSPIFAPKGPAACLLSCLLVAAMRMPASAATPGDSASIIEPLPILSYDTDAGFGYGLKAVVRNTLGMRESFDLVFFNSTKGERWYRLVVSLPDAELRQGSVYDAALDLTVDYDKWISASFFGVGSGAPCAAREFYTKEPLEISAALSRGFTRTLVGQLTVKLRTVTNKGFEPGSRLAVLPPPPNASTARSLSVALQARHDTRNSTIHPTTGMVLSGEVEAGSPRDPHTAAFRRVSLLTQGYMTIMNPDLVLALRAWVQAVSSSAPLPVQFLIPVGGSATLRGSPQDRYMDRSAAVVNLELRSPRLCRLGLVAGIDAGKVWPSLERLDLTAWAVNPAAGLRLYMETFVVRLDIGFGRETTGFFLNFGQLF